MEGKKDKDSRVAALFLLGKTPKSTGVMFLPQASKVPGPAPTPAKHQTPFPQGQAEGGPLGVFFDQ